MKKQKKNFFAPGVFNKIESSCKKRNKKKPVPSQKKHLKIKFAREGRAVRGEKEKYFKNASHSIPNADFLSRRNSLRVTAIRKAIPSEK